MSCKSVITIGRQFGSGGREIGKAAAEKLGIKFYDKELISLAAKESGVNPEIFENVDERATNSLLYSLSMGIYNLGSGYAPIRDLPVNDQLYLLQHKIIKQLAEEPCVIVGRCADYVLKDRKTASACLSTRTLITVSSALSRYAVFRRIKRNRLSVKRIRRGRTTIISIPTASGARRKTTIYASIAAS